MGVTKVEEWTVILCGQIIVVANRRAVTRHITDTTMHPDEIRDALAIDNDFSARQILIHYVDAKKSTGLKSLRDRLCDDIHE